MMIFKSIHGDKLQALLENPKLISSEYTRIQQVIQQYNLWHQRLLNVQGEFEEKVALLVNLLNDYKMYLDLEIVFDSEDDFLYRQKGQLKLDNTILEEFLPIFIWQLLEDEIKQHQVDFGANTCFSSVYFSSTMTSHEAGGGLKLRQKNQDFVMSKPRYLRASHTSDFASQVTYQTNIAYVAMECKTNLDKTMFQEAAATALDLKLSMPSAKYYLLCEWLDMTPISSSTTAIDEVMILRKAKRLSANIRQNFNTAKGRKTYRDDYIAYLRSYPFSYDVFLRLAYHIKALLTDALEEDVLTKGHF